MFADTGVATELTQPVEIFPMIPFSETPLFEFPAACTERSSYPTWEVANFSYTGTSSGLASLSLNLINLSTEKGVACSVKINETLLEDTYHRERWIPCETPSGSNYTDFYGTEVQFDKAYDLLGIRQTWKCPHPANQPPQYVPSWLCSRARKMSVI